MLIIGTGRIGLYNFPDTIPVRSYFIWRITKIITAYSEMENRSLWVRINFYRNDNGSF